PFADGTCEPDVPAACGAAVVRTGEERAAGVALHGGHGVALDDPAPEFGRIDAAQSLHLAGIEPYAAAAAAAVEDEVGRSGCAALCRCAAGGQADLLHHHAEAHRAGIPGLDGVHSSRPLALALSPRWRMSWNTYTTTPESVTSKSARPRSASASSACFASSGGIASSAVTSTIVSLPPLRPARRRSSDSTVWRRSASCRRPIRPPGPIRPVRSATPPAAGSATVMMSARTASTPPTSAPRKPMNMNAARAIRSQPTTRMSVIGAAFRPARGTRERRHGDRSRTLRLEQAQRLLHGALELGVSALRDAACIHPDLDVRRHALVLGDPADTGFEDGVARRRDAAAIGHRIMRARADESAPRALADERTDLLMAEHPRE